MIHFQFYENDIFQNNKDLIPGQFFPKIVKSLMFEYETEKRFSFVNFCENLVNCRSEDIVIPIISNLLIFGQ